MSGDRDVLLRTGHVRATAALACVGLTGMAVLLLAVGTGGPATALAVGGFAVLVVQYAIQADVELVGALPPRAPVVTDVERVGPVVAADLRGARRAAVTRALLAPVAIGLAVAASELSRSHRLGTVLDVGAILGTYQGAGALFRLWTLRRLARTPLPAVPVTVRAVHWSSRNRVVLQGPTLSWAAEPRGVLADAVVGDVVVLHVDPATEDPALVTSGDRRGFVHRPTKLRPSEVEEAVGDGPAG